MKIILVTVFSLLLSIPAFNQQIALDDFNSVRQSINKKGLLAIGSWSAANIVYGSIASAQTTGSTKHFHKMNAIWNTVTLGISAFGYLSAKKDAGLTYAESLNKQTSIEKVFLVNVGIDAAYIAGGFYIRERSKGSSKDPEMSKGYGESIILQGSVLLLFDAVMYGIHNKHGKQLFKMSEKINFTTNENRLGLMMKL